MSTKLKSILIIATIFIGIMLLFTGCFISTNNKAIRLEEQIKSADASIQVQYKRRADLIVNLVDCIESYNKYEQDTMTKIIEARSKVSNGNVEDAKLVINAVAEQYPELKSNENYKSLMTELALTENAIAENRNNFNIQIRSYNKFTRQFPATMFLGMAGYEKVNFDYTKYDNSVQEAPKNIFEK